MRRQSPRQWAGILLSAAGRATPEQLPEVIAAFAGALRRGRAVRLLPRIVRVFSELADEQAGVVQLKTVGAFPLSHAVIENLKESFGAAAVFDHTIDPHVIGGLRLQVGDVIIDGTVKTALQKLYEN